ncbi:hypothetical protein VitviT2T_030587 [Vitis vinifera]|uniref:Rx N-terminal domain-containing protein n=1 Tax=Vitis vinifera TaxID=29760 RepID=A0ABY9E309_VITVI|nr:hypothetical protein VitviT2T_030587 [Vitis vinifera]
MAEQIPFDIMADVLTKLGSSAIQQIGSAFGVAKELTKLTEKLDAIRGVLLDAEEKQEKSHAVKTWVRRLKDVVYDADDLLDDFATHQLQRGGVARQVSDFFSSSNQLVFSFKMSSRVKNIKEEVDEIVKEMNLLKLVQGNIVQREVESSWRETHSFVLTSKIVGREENKEEIIKSLVSSDNQEIPSMVAIVGIGGVGELTSLQSLPVFAVGNVRRAGRLSELKELNNLRGGLWIQGLENVRDVVLESREANLGGKQHIQSLRLNWRRSGAQSSEDVESVLEGLQPHRNLKKLCIEGYGGIRFPSWMMNGGLSSMLPNLTTVNLEGCSRCQTLPCFVRLPHLKSLQLDDLEKVEYMECSSEGPFFPSLENLNVNRMPKLKELWRRGLPTHPPPSLPCLSKLKIYFCDELASLELHSSPLLSQLEVVFCDELASLELHSSPLLSILEIHHCPKLTSLRLPQSPLLSRLDIRFCGDLASLELHSSPLLSSLKIFDCPKLTSVQASSLPCLKELKLMKVRDEVLRQSLLATASSLEKRCVPSQPSTYSKSPTVHTYPEDAKGKMVKIGPRLLMSQTLVLIGYGSDAESHFRIKKLSEKLKLIGVHIGLLFMEISKYLCQRWNCDTSLLSRTRMRMMTTIYFRYNCCRIKVKPDSVHVIYNIFQIRNLRLFIGLKPKVIESSSTLLKRSKMGLMLESYSEDPKIVQEMTEIMPGFQGEIPGNSGKGIPYVGGKSYGILCLLDCQVRWSNCSFQCFQGVGPVADVEKISSSSKLYKRELHNVLIKKLYG